MKITAQDGMVNIDTYSLTYANIRKMYKNRNGHGVQLTEELEPKRDLIQAACNEVAEKVYQLQDILEGK